MTIYWNEVEVWRPHLKHVTTTSHSCLQDLKLPGKYNK